MLIIFLYIKTLYTIFWLCESQNPTGSRKYLIRQSVVGTFKSFSLFSAVWDFVTNRIFRRWTFSPALKPTRTCWPFRRRNFQHCRRLFTTAFDTMLEKFSSTISISQISDIAFEYSREVQIKLPFRTNNARSELYNTSHIVSIVYKFCNWIESNHANCRELIEWNEINREFNSLMDSVTIHMIFYKKNYYKIRFIYHLELILSAHKI